jgi:hypothetical protein
VSDLFYPHNDETEISLDLLDDRYRENAFAVYDSNVRVYRLFVTRKGESTNHYCMNIDVDTFSYYPFDGMDMSCGSMCYDSIKRPFLVCAGYDGTLYKMFVPTNTDNGTPIVEYYTSPLVSVKDPFIKQGQTINFAMRPTSSGNLIVSDRVDFRSKWQTRSKIPCASSRDKFLGQSFTLGSSALGSERGVLGSGMSIPVQFNAYQFMLQSDTPTARAWEIFDISVNQELLAFGVAEAQR